MPNESITDALAEVYASAPTGRVPLDTITLSHASLAAPIYMVQDRVAHEFTLETSEVVEFQPVPFRFVLPATSEGGFQDLQIAIDNIDHVVTDFLDSIGETSDPLEVTYRPYLSDQPTVPQLDPPLVLTLSDVKISAFEVSGRASFADITNTKDLSEYYDRARFPGLGG